MPTPAAFTDEARNATFDPPKAARGRGKVERKPKPNPDGVATDETKTPKKKARPRSKAPVPSGAVSDTIVVRGVARACDAKRRVLTGGHIPRPKGRAPKGTPYWDSVAGSFAAADEDAR